MKKISLMIETHCLESKSMCLYIYIIFLNISEPLTSIRDIRDGYTVMFLL